MTQKEEKINKEPVHISPQNQSSKKSKGEVVKSQEYEYFIDFMATPSLIRRMSAQQLVEFGVSFDDFPPELRGIQTQQEFEKRFNLGERTTTNWKNREDFQQKRMAKLKFWAKDRTPNIVTGVYRSALKGNPASQKLWLQFIEVWGEIFSERTDIGTIYLF